eukprot:m.244846 g.244846  ORF g.244846 m.244846 type:complete len:59 (+) comp40247_c1_seq80:84-260(+)
MMKYFFGSNPSPFTFGGHRNRARKIQIFLEKWMSLVNHIANIHLEAMAMFSSSVPMVS